MALEFRTRINDSMFITYPVKKLILDHLTDKNQHVMIFERTDGITVFCIDDEEQSNSLTMDFWNKGFYPYDDIYDSKTITDSSPLNRRASLLQDKRVLILGAGAGGPARWVWPFYPKQIIAVDFDPEIDSLAKRFLQPWRTFLNINGQSVDIEKINQLNNPPVYQIIFQDAYEYILRTNEMYDYIVFDINAFSDVGEDRKWTSLFFSRLLSRLTPGGIFASHVCYPTQNYDLEATFGASFMQGLKKSEVRLNSKANWLFFFGEKA